MAAVSKKVYISSRELMAWSAELAKRIYASGWDPDVVIGLYRGGVFPAIVIEDYLRSKGVCAKHFPLQCSSYDPDKAESMPSEVKVCKIPEHIACDVGSWQRVLVVDDICDTGCTFSALSRELAKLYANANIQREPEVRRAVIAWKPGKHAAFKPSWWIKEYSNDDWVVFPHEFTGLSEDELAEKAEAEH